MPHKAFKLATAVSFLLLLLTLILWLSSHLGLNFSLWPSADSKVSVGSGPNQLVIHLHTSPPLEVDWNRADPIIRESSGEGTSGWSCRGLHIYIFHWAYDHSSGRRELANGEVEIAIHYALLSAITAILPAIALMLHVRKRTVKQGHCPNCGYDLRATPDRCPECGTSIDKLRSTNLEIRNKSE